jgi:transposase-like protein
MDITEVKWPARRRRGRYSNEFKREIVKACQAPGVSTASVALANGINANLLRRWVLEWGYEGPVREQHPEPGSIAHKPEFVQLASDVKGTAAAGSKLDLVLEQHHAHPSSFGSAKHPTQKRRCEACTLWITYNQNGFFRDD